LSKLPQANIDRGAESFLAILNAARSRAIESIQDAFESAKEKWDKSHIPSSIEVGDQVMISTKNWDFDGPKKLQEAFAGPFLVTDLVGPNAVKVILMPPYDLKHPVFSVSLCKKYIEPDNKKFPNRKQVKTPLPIVIDGAVETEIEKIVQERIVKTKGTAGRREYLVKWKGYDASENEWLTIDGLTNAKALLRAWRAQKREK
jgi:hypothetical protein